MTKPKKKNRFIYLYILIVLVLCFVIYLLPKLSDTMTKTVIAEYGTMELSDEVQCYAARNEKVYTAGSGGQTEYLVNEGEKVRKGTKVLKVSGGGEGQPGDKYTSILERLGSGARQSDSYTTATNGVISYYIDGYESTFTHKKIKKMTFDQVKDIQNDYMDLSRKSVLAGEPVYKLYKNEKWYMVFWIDEESASDYEKGRSVTVRLKDGEVEADIESVTQQENKFRVILVSNRYYKSLASFRTETATVITHTCSGLVLQNSCITEEDGQQGVYVRNTAGEYVFKPVQILLQGKKESVLTAGQYYDNDGNAVSTIEIYDEVLRNP